MNQEDIAQAPNLYFKAYYPLFAANKVTNTLTKESTELCMTDSVVYCHLLQRYSHFSKTGGKLFESQDTIANVLGLERKAIIRSIKRLAKVGMITQRTSYESGVKRSYYTVKTLEDSKDFLFETVVRERVDTGEIVDGKKKSAVQFKDSKKFCIVHSGYVEKSKCVPTQNKHNNTQNKPIVEDNSDAPF